MTSVSIPMFSRHNADVSTTPEIESLLKAGSPVAFGVSGGKDSTAQVLAATEFLDSIDHKGPRVLIHSDLGVAEWPESIDWCRKLAEHTGLELIVVRRPKGDMMDRWEQRWADNVARYAELRCVQLILPWSTAGMRFCTSEMKVAPICRELIRRFPGQTIISATGIRRQESTGRANAPIAKPQPKLVSNPRGTSGIDWHPIPDWSLEDVLRIHKRHGFPLHPAYTTWGVGRVSCMTCVLQSIPDAQAVARYPGSHALHRRVGLLEIRSGFAFQGDRWRAEFAPQLFTAEELAHLDRAKKGAAIRQQAESLIPKHLLYEKGWPNCVPTLQEAELLGKVRECVSRAVGIQTRYVAAGDIRDRYIGLMAAKSDRRIAA